MRDDEWSGEAFSDQDLVEQARNGQESAFNTLVMRHHEAVFRMAISMLHDSDAAEDVAQDAFVKAFRALNRFRGDSAFKTWLLTIAANEARGALRRQARRKESAFEDLAPMPSSDKNVGEAAVDAFEADRARRLLDTLPEKQRLSVTLRIEQGLSFREIGDVIGSSEGAARVNYFHGIRRLRELME